NLPYDPINDFEPISMLGGADLMLVATPALPAGDLQELIAHAKSPSAKLNYASVGNGGLTHLAAEYFRMLSGADFQQIPYKGTALALNDLVAGRVQIFFSPPTDSLVPLINAGKLKPYAITGTHRKASLPQTPT